MFVADLAAQFAEQVKTEHARHGFETEFYALACSMSIMVKSGRFNAAYAGPPPLILLTPDQFTPRRNFTAHHEIAHILLRRSEIETELFRRAETQDEALIYIEAFANFGASLLLMPEPLVEEARLLHGDTPQAILHITQHGKASLGAALRRYVYSDLEARRAAFVVAGNYISDAAAANIWLPFWRYDRVSEIREQAPDAALFQIGPRHVLGTVAW